MYKENGLQYVKKVISSFLVLSSWIFSIKWDSFMNNVILHFEIKVHDFV